MVVAIVIVIVIVIALLGILYYDANDAYFLLSMKDTIPSVVCASVPSALTFNFAKKEERRRTTHAQRPI